MIKIELAFVYGPVAASAERSGSDIDFMIIGSVTLSQIAPLLSGCRTLPGRPVNPTLDQPDEFVRRIQRQNHFLKHVLQTEPIFLKAGSVELARLTAGTKGKAAQIQPTRTQRPAGRR